MGGADAGEKGSCEEGGGGDGGSGILFSVPGDSGSNDGDDRSGGDDDGSGGCSGGVAGGSGGGGGGGVDGVGGGVAICTSSLPFSVASESGNRNLTRERRRGGWRRGR